MALSVYHSYSSFFSTKPTKILDYKCLRQVRNQLACGLGDKAIDGDFSPDRYVLTLNTDGTFNYIISGRFMGIYKLSDFLDIGTWRVPRIKAGGNETIYSE